MNNSQVLESSVIAPVWAGHYVAFMLKTRGDAQFAAFFDRDRYMTIAKRRLDSQAWQVVRVPSDQPSPFGARAKPTHVGWDSHNYIAFDFDADGQIHLSGNLHCEPLLYFRTRVPGDIATLERIDFMTGEREERVTYPTFIRAVDGTMIFRYRDGKSGSGDEVFNRYDPQTKKWSRLIASAFTDGRGKMNAYPVGPTLGPDGYFHLVWIWRDTPDCASNHDISYARTKDLQHWETSDGRPLPLPITVETAEIVDPVPAGGGAVNNNTLMGFDSQGRIVITFHKYDANGNTQVYNARKAGDVWRSVPATAWNHRWEFSGLGTIIGEVGLEPVIPLADGRLVQSWWSAWSGRGGCVLDEKTLEPIGDYVAPPRYPQALEKLESEYPQMQSRWCPDTGQCPSGVRYAMRWETLPANRDRARPEPWPEPSMLRVFKFAAE